MLWRIDLDEHIHSKINYSIETDSRTFWLRRPLSTVYKPILIDSAMYMLTKIYSLHLEKAHTTFLYLVSILVIASNSDPLVSPPLPPTHKCNMTLAQIIKDLHVTWELVGIKRCPFYHENMWTCYHDNKWAKHIGVQCGSQTIKPMCHTYVVQSDTSPFNTEWHSTCQHRVTQYRHHRVT